jgi:hypothetical protein
MLMGRRSSLAARRSPQNGPMKQRMVVSMRKFDALVCRSAWKMSIE